MTFSTTIFPRINFIKTFQQRLIQRIANGRVAMFFQRSFALSGPTAVTIEEGRTAVASYYANRPVQTWSLTGANAALFTLNAGVVTLNAPAVIGSYTYTVNATDADNTTESITTVVTVTADVTAPVVSGPSAVTVVEGDTAIGTYAASETSTWSLTGTNASSFSITSGGVVTFPGGASYGSYSFNVVATDAYSNAGSLAVTVTVNDVTPPVISGNAAPETFVGSTVVASYTANESVTWSLTGTNASLFNISGGGIVSYNTAPTVAGTASFNVVATDQAGNVSTFPVISIVSESSDIFAQAALDLNFANSLSTIDAVSGDDLVTFTRASNASYVDSTGVIRYGRYNYLLHSEHLDSGWLYQSMDAPVTTTVVAPDGDADARLFTSTSGRARQDNTLAAAIYTLSVYYKPNTDTTLQVLLSNSGSTANVTFDTTDPSNPTVTSGTGSMVDVGDGWFRASVTTTSATDGTAIESMIYTDSGYLWGAQLEEGGLSPYIPTTSVAAGGPRFDHDPATLRSLGLLVEESRTNLIADSNNWTYNSSLTTLTSGQPSPDGGNNATRVESNSTTTGKVNAGILGTIAVGDTMSVFIKPDEVTRVWLNCQYTATTLNAAFDFTNQTVTPGAGVSNAKMEPFLGGWYRCSMTAGVADAALSIAITLDNSRTTTNPDDNQSTPVGNGLFIFGAQVETGSFPSSYIPTTGSTVTRAADVASITGSNFSSWYNDTGVGTWYYESSAEYADNSLECMFTVGSNTNGYGFSKNYGAGVRVSSRDNNAAGTLDITMFNTWAQGDSGKWAFGLQNNNAALYHSSGNSGVDTDNTTPIVGADTTLSLRKAIPTALANAGASSTIKRLAYWSTRRTDQELQDMTLYTYDADAEAYLTAVEAADGQALEDEVRQAIDTFVVSCKNLGIWNAIKSSCIMAGARTLDGALVPLKGGAPTNFNLSGYDRKLGLVGNPINGRLLTSYIPLQNNNHGAVWLPSQPTQGKILIGNKDGDGFGFYPNTNSYVLANNTSGVFTFSSVGIGLTVGLIGIERSSSVSYAYRIGSLNGTTGTSNSTTPLTTPVSVFAGDPAFGSQGYPTGARIAFYSFGESLDLALLDSRVSALMNTLNSVIP